MKRKLTFTVILSLFGLLFFSFSSYANKTSVSITAPEKAEKGSEITIKIDVKHVGNTKAHYTDWVKVSINGEEYKKWEYDPKTLPDNQNFTIEFKVKVETNLEIIAEGNCNKHGSKGEDKVSIKVE